MGKQNETDFSVQATAPSLLQKKHHLIL